jgi:hypothetical protein
MDTNEMVHAGLSGGLDFLSLLTTLHQFFFSLSIISASAAVYISLQYSIHRHISFLSTISDNEF